MVDAHIEGEGFYRKLSRGDPDGLWLLSRHPDQYPKRARVGVYDQGILCAQCDGRLGKWDQYAQEVLFQHPSEEMRIGPATRVLVVRNIDYTKLKLFALSLLWRACVAKHPFYKQVHLGPYEDKAFQLLKEENAGPVDEFDIFLATLDPNLPVAMTEPTPLRLGNGVRFYRFCLERYRLFIKTDRRPTDINALCLKPGLPLYVWIQDSIGDTDLLALKRIIQNLDRKGWNPPGKRGRRQQR